MFRLFLCLVLVLVQVCSRPTQDPFFFNTKGLVTQPSRGHTNEARTWQWATGFYSSQPWKPITTEQPFRASTNIHTSQPWSGFTHK